MGSYIISRVSLPVQGNANGCPFVSHWMIKANYMNLTFFLPSFFLPPLKIRHVSLGWWFHRHRLLTLPTEVKPLNAKIISPPTPLVADRRYEVPCESVGSRPNAIITWYKGKRPLRRTKVNISLNHNHFSNCYYYHSVIFDSMHAHPVSLCLSL